MEGWRSGWTGEGGSLQTRPESSSSFIFSLLCSVSNRTKPAAPPTSQAVARPPCGPQDPYTLPYLTHRRLPSRGHQPPGLLPSGSRSPPKAWRRVDDPQAAQGGRSSPRGLLLRSPSGCPPPDRNRPSATPRLILQRAGGCTAERGPPPWGAQPPRRPPASSAPTIRVNRPSPTPSSGRFSAPSCEPRGRTWAPGEGLSQKSGCAGRNVCKGGKWGPPPGSVHRPGPGWSPHSSPPPGSLS